ncbi:transposase [Thermodesulfovibrio yellowstonii]|uniref:Transposase n=2 Tax=Thermodesulfovibrio yellowstonii TaxID=28262 RepID=A0A9W6GF54_9BACT|nr:transposase [Thermodesulfovibrio islandicus]
MRKVKGKEEPVKKARFGRNVNALTEEEKDAIVKYALGKPKYYHREMAWRMVDENIVYTSASTVYRILKENGLIRENERKKRYGWVHRYSNEASYPDELWQADITYIRYRNRDIYQLTFIDVYSRYVVLSVPLRSMDSTTVSRVFERLIEQKQDELQRRPKLQTDNGSCFIGSEFRGVVTRYLVEHTTIHPSTPTENVIIERWHRTFKELLYEQEEPEDFETLVKNIQAACDYYNYKRYHSSLKYMTPYEWYRGEPERIESERRMKLQEARLLRRAINCNKGKDSLFLTA